MKEGFQILGWLRESDLALIALSQVSPVCAGLPQRRRVIKQRRIAISTGAKLRAVMHTISIQNQFFKMLRMPLFNFSSMALSFYESNSKSQRDHSGRIRRR